MKGKSLNFIVFFPTILLFSFFIFFAFYNNTLFEKLALNSHNWILDKFGWMFLLSSLLVFSVCIWLYFSSFGEIVIGGKNAEPLLTKWNWFAITLCTTIAAGIIFWGSAEPVQHMLNPPISLNIEPMSSEASLFAISTIYRHWTFLPYGIYTILTVTFAFVYYNMKQPFSLGSLITPLIPLKHKKKIGNIVDIICVFSLVTGLCASLASGVLTISGGLNKLFGIVSNSITWGIILLFVGGITIFSAISGITKGIKKLSNFNIVLYIVILVFILFFEKTVFIVSFGAEGLGEFIGTFFEKTLFLGVSSNDPWPKNWTIFYLGLWMAWAPISAVFLGRISYGRKIKEVIYMNLFVTSMFGIVWFMIISGATINMLINKPESGLIEAFNIGYENVIYQFFQNLPLSMVFIPLYLIAAIISFVTAADSTTIAIASICSKEISPDSQESSKYLIVIWGLVITVFTWIIMSVGKGISGIKMLSGIGGLPSLFLILASVISIIIIAKNFTKYNKLD